MALLLRLVRAQEEICSFYRIPYAAISYAGRADAWLREMPRQPASHELQPHARLGTNCSSTLAGLRADAVAHWGRPRLKLMRESPASPEARDAAFEAIVTTMRS